MLQAYKLTSKHLERKIMKKKAKHQFIPIEKQNTMTVLV